MRLVILAAMSGTGKSSLGAALRRRNASLVLSVSHTTRAPREGEVHGTHYYFTARSRFDELIQQDAFAEWAEYVGNRYGTAKSTIEQAGREGLDLLFDIEIEGARQLKACYPQATSIFLLPPSLAELELRLRGRGTDTDDMIQRRLARGRVELAAAHEFDHLVVNDDFDAAVEQLEGIYKGETSDRETGSSVLKRLLRE